MTLFHTISPLDGRYRQRLEHLSTYFSEFALMRERCSIEINYLLALDEEKLEKNSLPFLPLSSNEKNNLIHLRENFLDEHFLRIKEIEAKTHHDVKSCELFLREFCKLSQPAMIHFGLTSEDVNNLAYSNLLKQYHERAFMPLLQEIMNQLATMSERWLKIPFPCRTHGQKATPSTAGKEIAVFLDRLIPFYTELKKFTFAGKLNGATGNFSALHSACPLVDWFSFSQNFVESLGLRNSVATTQIESHDSWAHYFNLVKQINNIILDLDVDMWLYIGRDLFREEVDHAAVGSSTMPHKVNPIHFENSEGNLTLSNALLGAMADKLTRSRMQRDLSDSTVERSMGVALAHGYLSFQETLKGLKKVHLDERSCQLELDESPELLAEPIQTILKTVGVSDAYEKLKEFTRGKKITTSELKKFIMSTNVSCEIQQKLLALTPSTYIGLAEIVGQKVLQRWRSML